MNRFTMVFLSGIMAILTVVLPAFGENKSSQGQPWIEQKSIDFDSALVIAQAGIEAARQQGLSGAVAVVNQAGQVIVLLRDDGASEQFAKGAVAKAWTALNMRASTRKLHQLLEKGEQDDNQLPSINGALLLFGGYPLKVDGQVVGGVGTASGTGEQDDAVAQAAVAAYAYAKRVSVSAAGKR